MCDSRCTMINAFENANRWRRRRTKRTKCDHMFLAKFTRHASFYQPNKLFMRIMACIYNSVVRWAMTWGVYRYVAAPRLFNQLGVHCIIRRYKQSQLTAILRTCSTKIILRDHQKSKELVSSFAINITLQQ